MTVPAALDARNPRITDVTFPKADQVVSLQRLPVPCCQHRATHRRQSRRQAICQADTRQRADRPIYPHDSCGHGRTHMVLNVAAYAALHGVVGGRGGGMWSASDLHSPDYIQPSLDGQQNWVLVGQPVVVGGRILAVVARPLATCDADDHIIQPGLPMAIIWATGTGWPSYHGASAAARGNSYITFAPPPAAPPPTPKLEQPSASAFDDGPTPDSGATSSAIDAASVGSSLAIAADRGLSSAEAAASAALAAASGASDPGLQALDVLVPSLPIPSRSTAYLCTVHKMPSDQRYHIVAADNVVQSPLLHHMILYGCTSQPDQVDVLFACENMPPVCQVYTIGWAPGIGHHLFPDEAGMPMGAGSTTYFMLQVHYNNPNQLAGQTDPGSGFRLYFTPHLRPNDLGVLMVGQATLKIPANTSAYTAPSNVCPQECTQRFPAALNIVSATPHMHTIGRSIKTQHIRGNQELPPLARRQYFDFNYQGAIPFLPATGRLVPGDALVTTCTFNSAGRNTSTKFGEASTDEMCLTFLTYWPRVPQVEVCLSMVSGAAFCSTRDSLLALRLGSSQAPTAALPRRVAPGIMGLPNPDELVAALRPGVFDGWPTDLGESVVTGALLAQYTADGRIVAASTPELYTPYSECSSLESAPWHT